MGQTAWLSAGAALRSKAQVPTCQGGFCRDITLKSNPTKHSSKRSRSLLLLLMGLRKGLRKRRGEGTRRTLALMGIVVLCGCPGPVVVEGSTAIAVGSGGVVLTHAVPVDLLHRRCRTLLDGFRPPSPSPLFQHSPVLLLPPRSPILCAGMKLQHQGQAAPHPQQQGDSHHLPRGQPRSRQNRQA